MITISSHLRINLNNRERAGVNSICAKIGRFTQPCAWSTCKFTKPSMFFQDSPLKFCLMLCSYSNWCILVLTCASLCLIISVHICLLHKGMNFLKTESLYRKLNLKTIYKECSKFSISRIFKNSCLDRDMYRDKRLNQMTFSRLPDLKVCF